MEPASQNKKMIIWGVAAALAVIVAFIFFVPSRYGGSPLISTFIGGAVILPEASSGTATLPTVEGGTRKEIDMNIATPDARTTSTNKDLAIPEAVVPSGDIKTRHFALKGNAGSLSPSIVVVNYLDEITLSLEAVDADYTVFIPDFAVSIAAAKGKTEKAYFQATNYGQYEIRCETCANGMKGTLIINKTQ